MYSLSAFQNNEALGSSSGSSNIDNSGISINGISSIISIVVQTQWFRKTSLYIAKSDGCEDV
jgi:hypothetical protein